MRFIAVLALLLALGSPAYAQYGPVNQGAVLLQPVTVNHCVKIAGPATLADAGANCGSGGSGLTSVGLTMPSIFTVGNSPLVANGTIGVTANGTSGGIPYFASTTTLGTSTAGAAGTPVLWGGAGTAPTAGTKTGTTSLFATATGTFTTNDCLAINSSGNVIDFGNACALPANVVVVTSSANITTTEWAQNAAIVVTAASVTLTLPAASMLNSKGGVFISAIGHAVTLAPNGTDDICTTSCVNSSLNIASGQGANAQTDGVSNVYVSNFAGGSGVTSIATNNGLTGGTITTTGTIGLAAIAADNLLANSTGSSAAPIATAIGSCSSGSNALTYNTSTHAFGCNTISGSGTVNAGTSGQVAYYATSTTAVSGEALSALMDTALGSTQGDVLYRNGTVWTVLAPGTNGQVLTMSGTTAPSWASAAGGGNVTAGTLTTGNIPKASGATAIANSALSDNGTILSTTESLDLTSTSLISEVANAGSTGTTVNLLAKLTGAPSTAVKLATTDTVFQGIVVGGAGTSGNAQIVTEGQASCVFDNATTAGDFVIPSTTTAGDCHDTAAATFPTQQPVGRVLVTNGSIGTNLVQVTPQGAGASSSGGGAPAGSAGNLQTYATSSTFGAITSSNSTTTGLNLGSTVAPVDALDIDQAKECIWNTTDHVTNFENLCFAMVSNVPTISNAKGGTGSGRSLTVTTDGSLLLNANTGNVVAFEIAGTEIAGINTTGLVGTNAAGGKLVLGGTGASSTVPTFTPNQSASSTGIGAQAAGNISEIVVATEVGRWTSTGLNSAAIGATTASTGAFTTLSATGAVTLSGLSASSTGDYLCLNSTTVGFGTGTCSLSDERAKQDIVPLQGALAEVEAFQPVQFRYKPGNGYDPAVLHVGFTAQRMYKVDPRVVELDAGGQPHAITYENITAINSAAIQEQQAEIRELRKEIQVLRLGEH